MAVTFGKDKVPFLLGGAGRLTVDTGTLQFTQPIPRDTTMLASVAFVEAGSQIAVLGQVGTIKLAVPTDVHLKLVPIFPKSSLEPRLEANGLEGFFANGANADKLILCLDIGASGGFSASGSFSYSALKPSFMVTAGADGGYAYLRAFDASAPLVDVLERFFATMRLPAQVRVPERGEAIALKYGGYLKLAAEVSAGYKLAGTKSMSVGEMALSERYDLSMVGKVGLAASVAGRFSILVTAADDLEGWARVRVHRRRGSEFGVAADVQVGFKNDLDHLPATANEFLGAALGVNAKSFINLFQKIQRLSDFGELTKQIDGLAKKYIAEYTGTAFDTLTAGPGFTEFLTSVNRVVKSYEEVGDRSVTLFDRYFDRLSILTSFLDRIECLEANALDTLRGELDPQLWNILSQLTDGDPLGFLVSQVSVGGKKIDSLSELKARSTAALSLIRADSHAQIRNMIRLAKESFAIDSFISGLGKIDTVDELKTLANEKLGYFVTRLVGRTLDSSSNLKQALKEIKSVLANLRAFRDKLYEAFKTALNHSYKLALHAEYSRASDDDALVDVLINGNSARGTALIAAAGNGDFEAVLATPDTNIVRPREGLLTHRTRRESVFSVNIAGWHLNYQYEGFDRVITETEQRLVPSDRGVQVFTTVDMNTESERKRRSEEMHVNFLLRALGESAKAVRSDAGTREYIIDTLTALTARYRLAFTDEDTSVSELRDYLAFAADLGLDRHGATFEALEPVLPRAANGGFGHIEASYDVRFGEAAVRALMSLTKLSQTAEQGVRNAMRRLVLSNYIRSDELHDVAYAYATPAVYGTFMTEGAQFSNRSSRAFDVNLMNPVMSAPKQVSLNHGELVVLETLYKIENSFISAIQELYAVLSSGPIDAVEFERKLGKFGEKLQLFDKFDQTTHEHAIGTNTIFAMLDTLVRLASQMEPVNVSVLSLRSTVNGKVVDELFLSDSAAVAPDHLTVSRGVGH